MRTYIRRSLLLLLASAAFIAPIVMALQVSTWYRCCPAHGTRASAQQVPDVQPVAVIPGSSAASRVLVLMEEPWIPDMEAAAQWLGTSLASRDWYLADSMARSLFAQGSFLSRIGPMGILSDRERQGVRHYWIVNAMGLNATEEEIAVLRKLPGVRGVVPDETVDLIEPNIRLFPGSSDARSGEDGDGFTYGLKLMRIPEFRAAYPQIDGRGVTIGQIDTGILPTHEQFAGKQILFRSFVDDTTLANDENGHGTHISGTIFGSNVVEPAIGMAPGVTKVYVAKVFTARGGATVGTLLDAMEWMADPNGDGSTADAPRLVSNSWGGPGGRETFRAAVQNWVRLGVFPVFAAGNSGPRAGTVGVPGGYPEALAVGAVDSGNKVASFSSRGPARYDGKDFIKPDVSAPGVGVLSAWIPKPGSGQDDPDRNKNYRSISGTSMATPHVAGALTLLLQAKPDLTVEQARELIESSTRPVQGAREKNNDSGTGLLDMVLLFDNLKARFPASP